MDDITRCRVLTKRLTWLLVALVALQLTLCAALIARVEQGPLVTVLGFLWLIWVASLVGNYSLVRCGAVAIRFLSAPRFVNRGDFPSRLILHLLINWSSIAASTSVAWYLGNTPVAQVIAWISLVAIVVVWAEFNILHRRINWVRNLTMSSLIATTLLLACVGVLLA